MPRKRRSEVLPASTMAQEPEARVISLDSDEDKDDRDEMQRLRSKREAANESTLDKAKRYKRPKAIETTDRAAEDESISAMMDPSSATQEKVPLSGTTEPPPRRKKKKSVGHAALNGQGSAGIDDFFDMGDSAGSKKKKRPRNQLYLTEDLEEDVSTTKWNPMPILPCVPLFRTEQSGSHEESDVVEVLDDKKDERKSRMGDPVGSERELSVTPPPPIFASSVTQTSQLEERIGKHLQELQNAKSLLNLSNFDLDKIKASALREPNSQSELSEKSIISGAGGDGRVLDIIVQHRSGPDFQDSSSTVIFKMKDFQPFREMIAQISQLRKVPSSRIVLARHGVRLFPSTTPSSLGFDGDIQLDSFLAEEFDSYLEYLGKIRDRALEGYSDDEEVVENGQIVQEQEEQGLIGLKLKEKSGEILKIKVPLTSTISELLQKLSQVKSAPVEKIKLKFDGDILKNDETLQDLDVEDGDTLELVIR